MVILAVDDEKDFLEAFASVLTTRGHSVLCACDGREALNLLESRKPSDAAISIIISDLLMPNLTGEEFLVEVKKSPIFSSIPFAIMSGNATGDQVQKLWNLGVDGVICKPFTAADLSKLIEATIKRKEERDMQALLGGLKIR